MKARRRLSVPALIILALALAPALAGAQPGPGAEAGARGGKGSGDLVFGSGFEGCRLPPVIADVGRLGAIVGEDFTYPLQVSCGRGQLSYVLTGGPDGLSVDAAGVLSLTARAPDIGDYPVEITVTDADGGSDSEAVTLSVILRNTPPVIEAIGAQTVNLGDTLLLGVSVNDPDPDEILVFSLDAAPAGLAIDPNSGQLSWTPGAGDLGAAQVSVRVTDRAGIFDTQSFGIEVTDGNLPPELAAVSPQGAVVGTPFTLALQATDPDNDPLAFSLPQGPAGLAVDAQTGLLSWTPTAAALGVQTVTVVVSDPAGLTDTGSFEISVAVDNRAPVAIDDAYTVTRGETLSVAAPGVLGNDADPDFDLLSAVLETDAGAGTLFLGIDGAFDYTPDVPLGTIGFVGQEFMTPSTTQGPSAPPRVADVNGDGRTDVVSQISNGVANQNVFYVSSPDTGEQIAISPPLDRGVENGTGKALADIDLDGFVEIISIGGENSAPVPEMTKIFAFEHDGTFKWESEQLAERYVVGGSLAVSGDGGLTGAEPTIADLDQDGTPEIIVGHGVSAADLTRSGVAVSVFDNQGMKLFTSYARGIDGGGTFMRAEVVDLDLDGDPEILVGSAAFSHTGELLWKLDGLENFSRRATPVTANLDSDPFPELIKNGADVSTTIALNHDGTLLWETQTAFSFQTFETELVVGDVDDDGRVEVLAVGNNGLSPGKLEVLNGLDGSLEWEYPSDGSGLNVGTISPTVFDLDGDGDTEVLLFGSQPRTLYVLEGETGELIQEFDLGLGNSPSFETPFFADVDDDGASELLLNGTFRFAPSSAYWVFESPGDDWAPTRSIWNQWNHHVTNVNPDGTVPRNEPPHWLLPGLNQNRLNGLLPEERVISADAFTYRADDGEFLSNEATVAITVLPPNSPPQILSMPRLSASPNLEYVYDALATDPDVGDSLSFELVQGPDGMSVDATGRVTWTPGPGDLGLVDVILQVTDSIGLSAVQLFTIEVRAAVTVPPVIGLDEAGAVAALEAADLVASPVNPVFSAAVPAGEVLAQTPAGGATAAAGSDVRIDVSRGPAPVAVPRVIGLDRLDAEVDILAAGLAPGTIDFVNRDDLPRGTVIGQDPAPGALLAPGQGVDLTISGGPRVLLSVDPPVITAGQSASLAVTVFDNSGVAEDPQPAVDLTLVFDAAEVAGPTPQLGPDAISSDAATAGVFRLQATIPASGETVSADIIVLPPVSDGEGGDVFSRFSAQQEAFDGLLARLDAAIDANDLAAIRSIDSELQALREALALDTLALLTPLAPEGGVPPDAATAATLGFMPGPGDDAFRSTAVALAGTLEEMTALLSNPATPDRFLRALNQQLVEESEALAALSPSVNGVLAARGPAIDLVGTRIPRLLAADIEAVRIALADSGLLDAKSAAVPARAKFSLVGITSASGIRNTIVKNVYKPLLGELVRTGLILAGNDALLSYTNAASLFGIVTASSQSIHIFEAEGSIAEGLGFDGYAPANTTILISPQKIAEVIELLNIEVPKAKNLKAMNSIIKEVEKIQKTGNDLVAVAESVVQTPDAVANGCFLSSVPGCRQLVYDPGFRSVYEAQGPFALPAPTLIVVYGQATGAIGSFVGIFLPTQAGEEEE